MLDALRHVLEAEPGVAYALLFGSGARGTAHPGSDADVAVELIAGASRDVQTLGGLAARLECAAARRVDLVLLDEAPAPLAYRIFRVGRLLVERHYTALESRKARVITEDHVFKTVVLLCDAGVLHVAVDHGR